MIKMYGIKISSGNTEITSLPNGNIDVESRSGNVRCGNVKNAKIITTSGNINIENAEEARLEATSGNIKAGDIKNAQIKTTSGGIVAENTGRILARVSSGNIKLESVSEHCELSTKSGSIRIEDCNLTENSSIQATSGGVHIHRLNDVYVDAKATSGSVKIENNDRKSDIELKINTTSGSIKVNK